ncbi:MAG: hypothetical protein P8X86_15700 [Desulfofustis sp.]
MGEKIVVQMALIIAPAEKSILHLSLVRLLFDIAGWRYLFELWQVKRLGDDDQQQCRNQDGAAFLHAASRSSANILSLAPCYYVLYVITYHELRCRPRHLSGDIKNPVFALLDALPNCVSVNFKVLRQYGTKCALLTRL